MFVLLGPVELRQAGLRIDLGPAKQRCVLAALLLTPGRVVQTDDLVDRVWGDRPPRQVRSVLRTYVARLRRALAAAEPDGVAATLRHAAGGYLIDCAAEQVDLHRARGLARRARQARAAGDLRAAAALLRQGLDGWESVALAGVTGEWADRVRQALHRERLELITETADLDLQLGRHAAVAEDLRDLVTANPAAEDLAARLMQALAGQGRMVEALGCYQRLRDALAEGFGADPSPPLQDLHVRILRHDVDQLTADPRPASAPRPDTRRVPRPVPAQLPADVAGFTGRGAELARLDTLLADSAGADPAGRRSTAPVAITVVSGTAGVGKTALAVHWAHRVAARFPDGQLHVNLRGFDPGGQVVEPAAAVRGFLDALGVPPERVPAGFDAQVGLYRSLLAGKRVLVVIDNARDAEHARPLLPGTPSALTVVTSRSLLTDLVAVHGAHPVALGLLTEAESRDLLERRLGPGRVAAEPEAVSRIIGVCTRLPLALALVAARAATHPRFPLAAAATELADAARDASLPVTSDDVIGRVRAVLSWSYTTLTPATARLFRLLGLHPGPDTTALAAASLAGLPPAHARTLLAELVRAGLLGEQAPGRYGFHDLLAAYATHLTRTTDTEDEREAATVRLLDHYTHTAHTATRLLHPARETMQVPLTSPAPGATPETPTDQQAALGWLDGEWPVLLAAQQLAAAAGRDTHAWQLAWALHTLLYRQGRWHEWVGAWQTALPAAGRLPRPAAATAYRSLGAAVTRLGDDEQAHAHLRHALRLHTEAADPAGQARTHIHLSILWARQRGQPDRALDHAQQALALFRAAGDRQGQANALNNVGWYHSLLGDHRHALTHCQQALTIHQELSDRWGEAATWDSLGYAHHHLNDHARAADCYHRALTQFRELGDRHNEANTLTQLGDTHQAAGHPDQARTSWTTALRILTALDHPDADTVRAKIATLDHRPPAGPGADPPTA